MSHYPYDEYYDDDQWDDYEGWDDDPEEDYHYEECPCCGTNYYECPCCGTNYYECACTPEHAQACDDAKIQTTRLDMPGIVYGTLGDESYLDQIPF